MVNYMYTGSFTYTSRNNRNAALAQINAAIADYPSVTPTTSEFATTSGTTTQGSTGLTVSYLVPEADIETFRNAMHTAWQAAARSSMVVTTQRLDA